MSALSFALKAREKWIFRARLYHKTFKDARRLELLDLAEDRRLARFNAMEAAREMDRIAKALIAEVVD